MNRHDDCGVPPGVPDSCVDTEFSSRAEDTRSKLEGLLDGRSYALLSRRASQFDPVIDKERKFISK